MFVACWEEQQVDLTVTALQTEVHTRAEEGGRRGGRELMVLIKKNSFKKKKEYATKTRTDNVDRIEMIPRQNIRGCQRFLFFFKHSLSLSHFFSQTI